MQNFLELKASCNISSTGCKSLSYLMGGWDFLKYLDLNMASICDKITGSMHSIPSWKSKRQQKRTIHIYNGIIQKIEWSRF